jgi:hypothetical protein
MRYTAVYESYLGHCCHSASVLDGDDIVCECVHWETAELIAKLLNEAEEKL